MAWNEPGGPNRDPWNQGSGGGKRGDGGPPDLDEMLKRLKARWAGKGPRPPSGGGSGLPNLPRGAGALIAAVIVALWACTGFYVVDEKERGVVMRLGAYDRVSPPGWGWHLPWPVESVELVQFTRVRQASDHSTMLTKDENIVDVEMSVQYRVKDAKDYLFSLSDPDTTLRQAMQSSLRETVGRSEMDFILTDGRGAIADRVKQQLQERLDDYHSGLLVTEVNLQKAQPPDAVQAAFVDAIKAREDQQRLKNEAEAYLNERLPQARGTAARQLEEATSYRDQVIARAQGDASRFGQLVAEYRKAPQVTRDRLYLDSMSEVLSKTSKVMIDVDKGSPMFYLPLEQLMKSLPKGETYGFEAPSADSRSQPNSPDAARSRERAR